MNQTTSNIRPTCFKSQVGKWQKNRVPLPLWCACRLETRPSKVLEEFPDVLSGEQKTDKTVTNQRFLSCISDNLLKGHATLSVRSRNSEITLLMGLRWSRPSRMTTANTMSYRVMWVAGGYKTWESGGSNTVPMLDFWKGHKRVKVQ